MKRERSLPIAALPIIDSKNEKTSPIEKGKLRGENMDKKKLISALVLLIVMLLFAFWPTEQQQRDSGCLPRMIEMKKENV